MNSQANTPFYLDKSLYVAILGVILPIINKKFNLGLDATEVAEIVFLLVAFIVGNKWKSGAIVKAEIAAASAAAGAAAATDPQAAAAAINAGAPK